MLNDFSQIDNDLGLNIIYFLQHGHWRVNEHSLQMEKIWFYNSEPSIDIQEYNSFAKNTTNTFIFTIIPDNNYVIKLSSPITVTIECKDGYYFINFSGDKSDIIYKVNGLSIIPENFFTLLSVILKLTGVGMSLKRRFLRISLIAMLNLCFLK